MLEQDIQLDLTSPPKSRSRLRMCLGRWYFTCRRRCLWKKQSSSFAQQRIPQIPLAHLAGSHKTPLFRPLQNVEMWLQYNKVNNLKLAAARINGVVLQTGETFSFWYHIGKPTRKKGYLDGMVLCNGSFIPGIGGGLCQLSNLIYWMTLHSPLTVTERWRHNYDVFPDAERTQPFGSGATVVYNYVDLQIRNDTNSEFQLLIWLDEDFLHGEWRSTVSPEFNYHVYEKEHIITHEWWGGYVRHNVINRIVYNQAGEKIEEAFVAKNHAIMMYEPMISSEPLNP